MMLVGFSPESDVAAAVYPVSESAGTFVHNVKHARKHSQHKMKGFNTHSKISNTNANINGV